MAKQLTEQDILNATTYVPLSRKVAMARFIAEQSVLPIDIAADEGGTIVKFLPQRYAENYQARSVGQMIVLLQFYLNQPIEGNFGEKEFDEWGESCVFNQLDRFKQSKNPEVRNKVYDLLDDYREFCKFAGNEIAMELSVRNDPIGRITAWLSKEIPPELIKKIREGLTEAKDELTAYRESKQQKGLED